MRCRHARVSAQGKPVRVRVQTELGDIVVEVDQAKAPGTSANFLKYVDAGHYDGGTWHRTVKMDNQPESTIKIEVIQAGVNPDKAKAASRRSRSSAPTRPASCTRTASISMARGMPDSATSGWFICINDQPSLDFGGMRNPDGQGFAAFGRVVSGMDVVRKIQMAPSSADRKTNTEAQKLTPPIKIVEGGARANSDRTAVRRASRSRCARTDASPSTSPSAVADRVVAVRRVGVVVLIVIRSRRPDLPFPLVADRRVRPRPRAGASIRRAARAIDFLRPRRSARRSRPTSGR